VSVRALHEDDLDQLFAIRQLSFLDRSDTTDEAVRARHAARLPYAFGHFLEGKLTSAAVCYPFEMFLAGQRVRAGGLAGVLSAPETRRRGFVRTLLADILERLHQDAVGWALEYPFDPRFYARYGFATVPNGYEVMVPAEKLFAGAAPDAERVSEGAADRLEAIYNAWAQHYSLTLSRDTRSRPTWSRILEGHRFCYLLPDTYTVLELREQNATQTLTVHDYAFTSPAGREALWRFIGAFYGQADLIRLHLPADDPLAFDVQRYHTNRVPVLQARITDLRAALEPLVSPTEESFALRVHDPFCGWNDGVFCVALGPSGSAVTPTKRTPELSLSIGALTQLVTGALGAAAALRAGLAEGDIRVAHALAALSAERVPFMPRSDYF
jgi:predicted acetyltransferase